MAEHNEIGKIGENVAVKFLEKKGFVVIDRNFHVKGGEIDIIALKELNNFHVKPSKVYFFEVKSKKVRSFKEIEDLSFRPENNLSKAKRKSLLRAIRLYLNFKRLKETETEIFVMAIIVFLEEKSKKAKVKLYENLPLL